MDAKLGSDVNWILCGIAYLVFRVIGRVEALEKDVAKLVAEKDSEDKVV